MNGTVVVVMSVFVMRRGRAVVEVEPHAQAGVELSVMGGFDEAQVWGAVSELIFSAEQVILGERIDLVEDDDV